ncbi:alanyl-tRNA editing protein [Mediterraneibacter glycyrrhizinilyticus]|uniref:alanyl-tRNA editing protein n=1 Tax=Mediterraneibacter glycyrrhizinilyticus TaxID=342942 RepID=UPI0025A37E30|nr:DHHA1 domain-containing protein [Mediterraneibacter glycyrrhizinilyticus]MDM8211280.1 DHHA1 domain-containing protein [Mediterraneibacter glycyrrhizinilyticus]
MTEKLFYQDSHLAEFEAKVLSCEPVTPDILPGHSNGYAAELDRTAFFPEGGGQYADTGVLGGVRVTDVQEKDGRILHLLESPLEPGTCVKGCIDWEERFMKMQQHSGEHIVSGLVHSTFGYNNVGFHLGSEDCTMDFDGELTKEQLVQIEQEANRAVWKNLEIQTLYPSEEELAGMEYRSKIEIEGQVRIVVVPGYDVCACCAPHVSRTGEIGLIKLTHVQRYKGGARVTMLCGGRALQDYETKQEQAGQISALLCAKENEIAEAVRHLRDEADSLKYELGEKEKKLIAAKAEMIPKDGGPVCVFTEDIAGDSMRLLMNLVLEAGHSVCAVFHGNDSEGYRYVIGSRTQNMRELVKEFNAAFDGRGGGKPEMVQGTARGCEDEMRTWILEKAGEA